MGGEQESDTPQRRNEGERFFDRFQPRIAHRVDDEINGAGEQQGVRYDLRVAE